MSGDKWEYHTFETFGTVGDKFDDQLNQLGVEGWELAWVVPVSQTLPVPPQDDSTVVVRHGGPGRLEKGYAVSNLWVLKRRRRDGRKAMKYA